MIPTIRTASVASLPARSVASASAAVLTPALSLLLAGVVLKVVLDAAYLTLMRDVFSAESDQRAGALSVALSYLLTAVASAGVSLDVALRPGPGNMASLLYLSLVVIPLLTLFGFGAPYADPGFVAAVVACLLLVVFSRLVVPALRVPPPGVRTRVVALSLLAAGATYVYAALAATGGLGRLNFDLSLVYEVREDLETSGIPLANYVIPWQAYVVNMAVLALCAHRGWWLTASAVLAAQVLLFGMTNYKSFLFAPAMVLGVLWLARSPVRVAWGIVLGSALLVLAAWSVYVVTEQVMIPSIFVRRLFFVPGELHLWYHDFFSVPGNPFVTLSNSVLAAVAPYPFAQPVPLLIGWLYTGAEIGANVGWMADAYAHFGFAGMAAFAVLLAVILRVLDGVSAGLPNRLATSVVVVPTMALVNSGLLTVMLTHGFGLAVLLLWLMNSRPGMRA